MKNFFTKSLSLDWYLQYRFDWLLIPFCKPLQIKSQTRFKVYQMTVKSDLNHSISYKNHPRNYLNSDKQLLFLFSFDIIEWNKESTHRNSLAWFRSKRKLADFLNRKSSTNNYRIYSLPKFSFFPIMTNRNWTVKMPVFDRFLTCWIGIQMNCSSN